MSRIRTGIGEIDEATKGGVPSSDLSVVATTDDRTGSMVLGHYLKEGLQAGETVLLASFERLNTFFENFHFGSFDFKPHHANNKFLYFNFVPSIRHKVGFLSDYRVLFDEIYRLSGAEKPSRIAFHQVDAFINLSNTQLIHLTSEKLASACHSGSAKNATVLAQFIKFGDKPHDSIAVALEKAAAGYIELLDDPNLDHKDELHLRVRKMPWFEYDSKQIALTRDRVHELLGQTPRLKKNAAA